MPGFAGYWEVEITADSESCFFGVDVGIVTIDFAAADIEPEIVMVDVATDDCMDGHRVIVSAFLAEGGIYYFWFWNYYFNRFELHLRVLH